MLRSGLLALTLAFALAIPARAQRVVVRADSLAALVRYSDTLRVERAPPYRLRPFVRETTLRVRANGAPLDTSAYRLDARRGLLTLTERAPYPLVQLVADYETWGWTVDGTYGLPGVSRARADTGAAPGVLRGIDETPAARASPDPFGGLALRRSGSITRGVLAGSNRDVAIESGLRVQLDGEVAPGVRVEAALTDENTPILAEGTTQRLSEFDRVYVGVTTKNAAARLGDFDFALEGSELARFGRKLQGGTVEARVGRAGPLRSGRVVLAGATPRGQFRIQEIVPIEGVQGPYRLEGAAGEPFILVVPGSEVVYLNGVRLVRDRDGDYTIEYATGELAFTSRRLLTATDRITAEFQYTAGQFPRTLVGGRVEAGFLGTAAAPRLSLGATVLREADRAAFGPGLDLSADDSLAIIASGDGLAFRSGATLLPRYEPEAPFVQYRRALAGADTIYVALEAAPADTEAVYRVRFSRVAAGTGSYVRAARTISGIAYEYAGRGRGEYEPVRLLPKPRAQSLVGFQATARPARGVEAFGEWAASGFDENRFSAVGEGDDRGRAYVAGVRIAPQPLGRALRLTAEAARRARTASFVAFDRTRPIDFRRRWNLTEGGFRAPESDLDTRQREVSDEAVVRLDAGPRGSLALEGGRLLVGTRFTSRRASGALDVRLPRVLDVRYGLDAITSRDDSLGVDGSWTRGQGEVRRALFGARILPGVAVEHERRVQRLTADTLAAGTRGFVDVRPGVRYTTEPFEAALELSFRREDEPLGGRLIHAADAAGVQASYRLRRGPNLSAEGRAAVRQRRFVDAFVAQTAGAQTAGASTSAVAIQQNVRYAPFKRAAELTVDYEAQTERTPQLQELYVRVTPEIAEARYVWQDRDGDGARDLDEFLQETTPYEGTYARTFVPTDTLVGVAGVQARIRLALDPSRALGAAPSGLARALANVSARTTLDVDEQSREPDPWRLYVLDLRRFQRPGVTISGRMRVAQDVSLFRRSRRFGLDVGAALLRSRSNLASGEEARRLRTFRAEGRYRPSPVLGLRALGQAEANIAESDRFATRRYRIDSRGGELAATLSPRPALSATAGAAYSAKRDVVGVRSARVLRLPLEARYARAARLVATGTFEAAFVRLRGDAVGEAAYELTEGRGPGRSLLWNAALQYVLTRTLSLSVAYDGRAPQSAPSIHTLRMQVSASF